MYEQVFNFNSRPFTSTPYVKHYFPASAMNQAFGQASICIERGSGPVVAIGDIGTGKSLLLAKLESEYQAQLQVVNLVCSSVNSRREFLQNILFQIGKPFNMDSETELRFAVIQSAQPTEASPNGMLMLIDDAEMLTADVFDELRVLSNVVVEGTPQVRLVLAGRKSLEERLADPAHASFSQRIASRVFLSNLSRDETAAYVVEHINRVGGDGQSMFPGETAAKLQELTDGCPRLINQVCDFGLILAGTRGLKTVSATLIEEAWNDVQSLPMGSGSLTTEPATQSAGNSEDNDWTLIEFGQLDDDSLQPHDATVYDFENSAPVEESTLGYSEQAHEELQNDAPSPEAEQSEPEAPRRESKVDTELGIDLGSLQAMQDAAAKNQAAALQQDADSSTEESSQETPADGPDAESNNQGSADDAARIAMEQQLAAVFGTSLPSSTPAEPEASDTSSEVDAPVQAAPTAATGFDSADRYQPLQPEVPNENQDSDATNSIVGTLAGSALAAGALAAAVNSFTPEVPDTPAVEEGFNPATSALLEPSPNVDEPVTNEESSFSPEPPAAPVSPDPAPQSTDSFTPAFPVDEAGGFVPATQPLETSAQTDIEAPVEGRKETQVDQPETQQAPIPATPVATDNPFGESFAVEAHVPSRATSDTIEQNQNALKISSADLEHVQPVHVPTPDEIVHPAPEQAAEALGLNAGSVAGVNWLASPTAEANETPGAEDSAQPTAPEEPPTDSPIAPPLEAKEEGNQFASEKQTTLPTRGFSIMPMAAPSEPAPSEPAPASLQPVEQAAVEQTQPAPAAPVQASSERPHEHKNSSVSEEISRQADEILARANKVETTEKVSQEAQILNDIQSQQSEVTDSQLLSNHEQPQTSLPTPTPEPHQVDPGKPVVQPEVSPAEISRQADEILARLNKANKPAGVNQEEQILTDIQTQQRVITDSQLLGNLEQPQASLPIPTSDPHQDDSGMLVVNPEASSTEKASEPQSFPMTDSPISSGRAARMDYEKLFDRLRNLPEGDQQ